MLFSFSSLFRLVHVSFCLNQPSAGSVFSRSVMLGLSPFPLWPHSVPCGSSPGYCPSIPCRHAAYFLEWILLLLRGILVHILLGECDQLGAVFSEFPEALPVRLLDVPVGKHFSCTGVGLLGKGQDYRFVIIASQLLTDFSFGNLLAVVSGYGNIRCSGCFPLLNRGWGIGWGF